MGETTDETREIANNVLAQILAGRVPPPKTLEALTACVRENPEAVNIQETIEQIGELFRACNAIIEGPDPVDIGWTINIGALLGDDSLEPVDSENLSILCTTSIRQQLGDYSPDQTRFFPGLIAEHGQAVLFAWMRNKLGFKADVARKHLGEWTWKQIQEQYEAREVRVANPT